MKYNEIPVRKPDVMFADYLGQIAKILKVKEVYAHVFDSSGREMNYKTDSGLTIPPGIWSIYSRPKGSLGSEVIANFSLNQLFGLCGTLVSHSTTVYKGNKGIGTILQKMKIEMAKSMGYGLLLISDIPEQHPYNRRIIQKAGYKDIYSFKNPRTTNKVVLSVINLVENPYLKEWEDGSCKSAIGTREKRPTYGKVQAPNNR